MKKIALCLRGGGRKRVRKKKHGRFEFQDNILFGAQSK